MTKQNNPPSPQPSVSAPGGYSVLHPFRDQHNFDKQWTKGDDVSHFDADRLSGLVELGLVQGPQAKPQA